jgi:hypothetical protein
MSDDMESNVGRDRDVDRDEIDLDDLDAYVAEQMKNPEFAEAYNRAKAKYAKAWAALDEAMRPIEFDDEEPMEDDDDARQRQIDQIVDDRKERKAFGGDYW